MEETNPITFEKDDRLGLKPFSEKLEKFLMVENDFVEGSLVISLDAPFGAGKTTFLSMWKSDLEKRREVDTTVPKVVMINAWESDYCGDALLSIVNGLIESAKADSTAAISNTAERIKEAAKDVGWFVTGLANHFASHWAGIDPAAAGGVAEDKKKGRQIKVPDFVTLYEERAKALGKLKDTLRDVLGGEIPKAFVFVDELDRCRPDYAITYLETIKHVFDVHGLVFVLAVDREQLECSAKALFGEKLRFSDYFRKFAQRTVTFPEPDETGLRKLAYHYATHYLEKEGRRTSLLKFDEHRVGNVVELIAGLRMPPRQIQEAFRIIGHTVMAADSAGRGRIYWCLGVGVILMSVCKVAALEMYRSIGKGTATHEEVGKFLVKLVGKKKAAWWFCIYLTGAGKREGDEAVNLEDLFKSLGLIEKDSTFDVKHELGGYASGWGHSSNDRWKQIHDNIETATTF